MADKFGMMSAAYFKGKRELLQWGRDFLKMDISKVEDFASGAHYCQLLDAMFPRAMAMHKVNFAAKTEPEYIKNWKLIQGIFERQGIQKVIPVEKLTKGRFQDNLEFLQWFHQYFRATYSAASEYDAVKRRQKAKGSTGLSMSKPPAKRRAPQGRPPERTSPAVGARRLSMHNKAPEAGTQHLKRKVETLSNENGELVREKGELVDKLNQLEAEYKKIQNVAKEIENERDFYFQKVVQVETLTKELPDQESDFVKSILKILYAHDESLRAEDGGDAEMGEM